MDPHRTIKTTTAGREAARAAAGAAGLVADRLKAAAPEMLEALVIAEANLWPHTGHGDAITDAAWRKVRSVIAKARGERS